MVFEPIFFDFPSFLSHFSVMKIAFFKCNFSQRTSNRNFWRCRTEFSAKTMNIYVFSFHGKYSFVKYHASQYSNANHDFQAEKHDKFKQQLRLFSHLIFCIITNPKSLRNDKPILSFSRKVPVCKMSRFKKAMQIMIFYTFQLPSSNCSSACTSIMSSSNSS